MRKSMTRIKIFFAIALFLRAAHSALAQGGPALVEVATVAQREIGSAQTFVGTVMPLKKAIIGSAVDGRVTDFPVNEGDFVPAQGTLAQLLTDTISSEIKTSEAEL